MNASWVQKNQAPEGKLESLTAETVEGTALALESLDHIGGGDSLPLGVLGVGDRVLDHVLQKYFQDPTGLLVNEPRDALHTTTTSQAAESRLSDALDVVAQNLAVALSAAFPQAFTAFPASGHGFPRSKSIAINKLVVWCCP